MYYRDPKCVYVADSPAMAGLVQGWLASHRIETEVMNQATLGGFEGLTWIAPGISHRGLEVWVLDADQAEPARTLLAEQAAEIQALESARANRTGTISVACQECGKENEYPASQAGRTEHCRYCGRYLDVPDSDATPEDEYWRAGTDDIDTE
jgi:hypothetical protein